MRLRAWHVVLLLGLALAFTLNALAAYPAPPAGLAELGRTTFPADNSEHVVPIPSGGAAFCMLVEVTAPIQAWLDLGNVAESGWCGLTPSQLQGTWPLAFTPETYWSCSDPPECTTYEPQVMPTSIHAVFYGSASSPGSGASAASSSALTEGTFTARIGKLETLANLVAGCGLVMLFGFGYSIGRGAS